MNAKWLNLGVLITSLIGYHEWGSGNSGFLFQMEWEVIAIMIKDIGSAASPFIILPLLGQMMLLITLFQKTPAKKLTITGIIFLSILLVFIFLIGLVNLNIKTILSFMPYLTFVVLVIRQIRNTNRLPKGT